MISYAHFTISGGSLFQVENVEKPEKETEKEGKEKH